MSADRAQLDVCLDLLGPLTLRLHGNRVEVPGGRRRALLALLALEGGRAVGADRLVDSLWPEDPPGNALQALYNHVSRLRGHLGPASDRLERYGAGYRLHLEEAELDVDAAQRWARAAVAPGTAPATSEELLRSALELWRGPALEEFAALPALVPVAVKLEELRLRLRDDLMESRLRRGDRTLAADATEAATEGPLRERSALLLVEALAAERRTADAMAAAQSYRRRLSVETGLDPSPALAELEQRVARGEIGRPPPSAARAAQPAAQLLSPPDGPMVGRQHDREEVLRLLADHPVVTLTGPGGVGKTRLALDVAADTEAHAGTPGTAETVVVDLAAVGRPERVCQAVASTFRLRLAGDPGPDDLAAALAGRQLLMVLDNCEHVADACRELVVTLRRSAPGVRVLATSRAVLHLPGEHVVRLQPLPVPREVRDLQSLRRQPAVRAFVEHARRRVPGYDVRDTDAAELVEILRRLDGLPLGIELAARQVAVMPLRAVRERLDRALDLVTEQASASDGRQRSLRASIDSSYRLLAAPEQELLRALAPFPGGVDLATVEALGRRMGLPGDPLDVLHRLVDASLLVADLASERFRLLFTVRAFLLDELRLGGELDRAEERFARRCLEIARQLEQSAVGPHEAEVDRRLRDELDNLRAASDVTLATAAYEVRVGIAVGVADACSWRDLREPWLWALELAADPGLTDPHQRLPVLGCAAEAARLMGDQDRATALAEEAFALAGPYPDPAVVDRAWSAWASAAHYRGDFDAAQDGWRRAARGRVGFAGAHLASAALAAAYGGDRVTARSLLAEAHAAVERTGSPSQRSFAAYVDGEIRGSDDLPGALLLYDRAITGARTCGATFVEGVARVARASALTRTGDVPAAADEFRALLESWETSGQRTQLWTTARNAAFLLARQHRHRVAAMLLVCAERQPAAAAVSPSIARHSGRLFVPLTELVSDAALEDVVAEVTRLGPPGVLAVAREELLALSRQADA